jgi:hypothetical protein
MSNATNSPNKISNEPNGMGRSISSARFQIAKVYDDDTNATIILGKANSIPNSM